MNQEEFQDTIIAALENNEWNKAYSLLMDYYDQFGSDYFYLISLSDVLLHREEYQDVIILLSEYEDKNDLLANERLADAYLGLGFYEKALSKLESLPNEDNPDLLHSFYLKGMAYYLLGQYENALDCFEDILLETEDRDTLCAAALAYGHIDEDKRALECLEKLSIYPEYLSQVLPEFLEMDEDDIFEQSIEYLKDSPSLYYHLLASLYFYRSWYDEALQAINKSLEQGKDIHSLYLKMCILSELHDDKQVQSIQKEILDTPFDISDFDDFFLVRSTLDKLYPALNAEKEHYIHLWMSQVKTVESYFDLGYYLDDHLYSDLLNELLNDMDVPTFYYMRDANRYQDLTVDWYFMNRLYEEAYDYLVSITYRRDAGYYRNLALSCGFMGKWEKVLNYAKDAMPDGIAAVLGIQAATILKDDDSIQFFKDSMEKARGSIFDSNMYCYDNYLETGVFLLPERK